MKVVVEREGYEVKVNGIKCPVNKQASKGEGQEYVDIEKLGYTEWQKHIRLAVIKDNDVTEVELKPRKESVSSKYTLTQEEKDEIAALQAKIDAIVENAKKRYTPKKKLEDMSIEELEAYIANMKASK